MIQGEKMKKLTTNEQGDIRLIIRDAVRHRLAIVYLRKWVCFFGEKWTRFFSQFLRSVLTVKKSRVLVPVVVRSPSKVG